MLMFQNPMVMFTRCTHRVNMDSGIAKIWQVMQECMSHFLSNTVTLFHRQV